MLFAILNHFVENIVAYIFCSSIAAVLYYRHIFKSYTEFPSCRLEFLVPYWALLRRPLNVALIQTFIEQSKKHKAEGMFVAWTGQPLIIVYGDDIVKKIVNEPAARDKPNFYKLIEVFVGKGIISSNGESYKKQKKMVSPAFYTTAVKSYTAVMNKNSEALVKGLYSTEGQPFDDLIEVLSECTLNTMCETSIGNEETFSQAEKQLIFKTIDQSARLVVKRVFFPLLYFDFSLYLIPSTRKICRLAAYVRDNLLKSKLENLKASLISRRTSPQEVEADPVNNGSKLIPLGETFVEQHLKDPTISMEEIAREVSFLFTAGFHTIVHSLKYSLFLLGLHQDVQDRARKEVMAQTEGYITYEDQQSLTYLECVIKEALRIYSVPLFGRFVQKELDCGKYKIPRNSNILVFSYMVHRNPEIFPNPEKFDPERFMNNNSNIKPWQFIPFAEGIRQCTGKYYAMIQMKIILAHILRHFKVISLDRREDVEVKWAIVLECTKKLRMQFLPIRGDVSV